MGPAVAGAHPELEMIAPETMEGAEQAIAGRGGRLWHDPARLCWRAREAALAAGAAGGAARRVLLPELIAHPVAITNFREIYNDHIAAHIMSFVLAFARGLQIYLPQQLRREWQPAPREDDDVVHLPEATALIVGVGGIGGETARLAAAFGMRVIGVDERRQTSRRGSPNCTAPPRSTSCCRGPIS